MSGPDSEARRILIIEDDEALRDELVELFGREGHRCNVAKNGEEARRVMDSGEHPDLVILDLGLDSGKFEAREQAYCMNLRRQLPGISIIGVSSSQLTGEQGFELRDRNLVDAFFWKGSLRLAALMSRLNELLPPRITHREVVGSRRVFISYDSGDRPYVVKLAKELETAGYSVWYDKQDLKSGDNFVRAIVHALETDALVAVLSHHPRSRWVEHELSIALGSYLSGKISSIVPVRLAEVPVPLMLAPFEVANFFHDYREGLNKLLAGLRTVRGPS
jgi:CheY-like chemotaxis protein